MKIHICEFFYEFICEKMAYPANAVVFDAAVPMMNPVQELCSRRLHLLLYLAYSPLAPWNNRSCSAHPWGIRTQGNGAFVSRAQGGCSDLQAIHAQQLTTGARSNDQRAPFEQQTGSTYLENRVR